MFVVRVKLHDDEIVDVRCCHCEIDFLTNKLIMTDQNKNAIGEFDRDCVQYWCVEQAESGGARDANIA